MIICVHLPSYLDTLEAWESPQPEIDLKEIGKQERQELRGSHTTHIKLNHPILDLPPHQVFPTHGTYHGMILSKLGTSTCTVIYN